MCSYGIPLCTDLLVGKNYRVPPLIVNFIVKQDPFVSHNNMPMISCEVILLTVMHELPKWRCLHLVLISKDVLCIYGVVWSHSYLFNCWRFSRFGIWNEQQWAQEVLTIYTRSTRRSTTTLSDDSNLMMQVQSIQTHAFPRDQWRWSRLDQLVCGWCKPVKRRLLNSV